MPGATPIYAFPYPVGTDLIANGDDVIQALAERVETVLSVPAAWTGVAFGAGWANYGAPFSLCQYRKVGSQVYLRGVAITAAGVAANATIFTLPVGYRPLGQISTGGMTGTGAFRLDIDTFGRVFCPVNAFAASGFISIWLPPFWID